MWNKCKVVMLASNENSGLLLGVSKFGRLISYDTKYTNPSNDVHISKQHIYIISEDEIKVGDWCIDRHKTVYKQKTDKIFTEFTGSKKIIATTDKLILKTSKSINKEQFPDIILPQISQQFIEHFITEYNKGNIISDVLVEYEYLLGNNEDENQNLIPELFLKINKNNTINIKTVKDSFSRDEVIKLLQECWSDSAFNHECLRSGKEFITFNNWLEKENL